MTRCLDAEVADDGVVDAEVVEESAADADGADEEPEPLPIAGYDELTAREIVGLLDELTTAQRQRIRVHEESNRQRKTVLGKLDRLDRLDRANS